MKRPALSLSVMHLRCKHDVAKGELARRLGHGDTSQLGKWEKGTAPLSREMADRIAELLGEGPEANDVLCLADEIVWPERPAEPPTPVALTEEELRELDRAALAAAWAVAGELRRELPRQTRRQKAAAALAEAAELWAVLEGVEDAERRELVEVFPPFRSWAVAVRACEASVKRAAHRADEALELARFALYVAERVEEDPGFKRRLVGYCRAYMANARRVANDFDGADEDYTRAVAEWQQGHDADPPLLEEWRLLSLGASLRRAQQRFPEALDLLDRAMAASGGEPEARARLLLKKEHVLEQSGDPEGALAVLEEARPLVEGAGDPRLLFGHRFNLADNLVQLQRFQAARPLLEEARRLALELAARLHLVRVVWLEARVNAGLGEKAEAEAALEQVRGEFAAMDLPYDAALASLDLAVLWLEDGRAREVRQLAEGLHWIFQAQKIDREALAALALFREAARSEAATVKLTRQVIADIERARRLAPRPGTGAGGRG